MHEYILIGNDGKNRIFRGQKEIINFIWGSKKEFSYTYYCSKITKAFESRIPLVKKGGISDGTSYYVDLLLGGEK